MPSYWEQDIAVVDPVFGVQLHHPRFLECIGARESAGVLGLSLVEWIRTMNKHDAVSAALQLQHDAGLMASNLQVLGQYVTSLNFMSSEVMRLAFGPELCPTEAIDAIAPVPRVHRQPRRCPLWVSSVHRLAQAFLALCRVILLNN